MSTSEGPMFILAGTDGGDLRSLEDYRKVGGYVSL